MSENEYDIFLFGGFPYKNGSLDMQKMRLYGIVLNAARICATISILLGFVILSELLIGNYFSGAAFIIAENIPNKIYTNIAAINPLSTSVALCKIL